MYDELIKRLRDFAVELLRAEDALLVRDAADAIEELQEDNAELNGTVSNLIGQIAELSNPKWIPVAERLPEYGRHVLVYAGFFQPYIEVGYYCEDRKWRFTYDDAEIVCVSHWMPLPDPPKEGE